MEPLFLLVRIPFLFEQASSDMGGSGTESSASGAWFRAHLEQARDGSDEALGELVQSCQAYLLLVANQDLGDHLRGKLGASDAVQETMAAAHQRFDQFQGATREELVGWLRAILHNHLLMTHRQFATAKRDVRREQVASESVNPVADQRPTPHGQAVNQEDGLRLRNALSQLSDDHRQVILLRNWEQLSFRRVAEQLGRSEDAVKKLWARAMTNLKQQLSHDRKHEPD